VLTAYNRGTQCPHRNHGKMTDYHRAGAVIKPGEGFRPPLGKP
jgi:hypothetical protein